MQKAKIIIICFIIVFFQQSLLAKDNKLIKQMKWLVKETIVQTENGKNMSAPNKLIKFLKNKRAGVFVTFKDVNGRERACWGTIEPQEKNLAWEIISNTKSAIKSNYRYLSMEELQSLKCYVSVVKEVEMINNKDCVRPAVHGLRVSAGGKAGVLLPGEAKTVRWQILECLRKAGLIGCKNYSMERFKTDVYSFNFKELINDKK